MNVKLTIHRTTLDTLLKDGHNNLRVGMCLHYTRGRIIVEDMPEREEFILRFGRIFRGKDGTSAYEDAVKGGFKESREVFQRRLAGLTDMDEKPTKYSKNTVTSGGVYDAIDESHQRWMNVIDKTI